MRRRTDIPVVPSLLRWFSVVPKFGATRMRPKIFSTPSPLNSFVGAGCTGYSQSNTVPSRLPLARVEPSGLKDTPETQPVCPVSVRRCVPVFAYYSRTVWSPLPLARIAPSRLKDTLKTHPMCPASRANSSPECASYIQISILLAIARRVPSGE